MKTKYLSYEQLCYRNNQDPKKYDGKEDALKAWGFFNRPRKTRRGYFRKLLDRLRSYAIRVVKKI